MSWVSESANRMNAETERRAKIARGGPVLWDNICRAIKQVVREYGALNLFPVEFSERADHTIGVVVFNQSETARRGEERELVTISFDAPSSPVLVSASGGAQQSFPLGLNAKEQVVLLGRDGNGISLDAFTELALKDAFFPSQ